MVKKIRRVVPIASPVSDSEPRVMPRVRVLRDTVEYRPSETPRPEQSSRTVRTVEDKGRAAWRELHTYDGCSPDWFQRWLGKIPCGTCKEKSKGYIASNPPDFSSPSSFWAWGWRFHNWVNASLGKPQITIEEATNLWRNDANEVESENQG
jgi:hypothetical protein